MNYIEALKWKLSSSRLKYFMSILQVTEHSLGNVVKLVKSCPVTLALAMIIFHQPLVCPYVPGVVTSVPNFKENKLKKANRCSGVPDHQWHLIPRRCDMLLSNAHCLWLSVSLLWPTSGETVLHRAASLCHRTICHYLVEAGASLMKTDLQVGSV